MADTPNVPLNGDRCEWCDTPCKSGLACSSAHAALIRQREVAQAVLVIRQLKLWRKHRGRKDTPGQGQIGAVASLVDKMLKADRKLREKNAPKLLPAPKAKPSFKQEDIF